MGRVYSFRDITRQTEVQASLRLAARVFDSSLDAIFIADSQHQLMRMNPGCERLVGPCSAAFEGCLAASLFGSGSDASFMEQVLAGKFNKVIADELNISMRTVEVHRANLFDKMQVKSAVELANLLRAGQ